MLFDNEYKTILACSVGEFKDRGSRFIGYAYSVNSEKEVKEIVSKLRKEHPKANHHCYAFRIGPGKNIYRFSDDREPSGSAGKPIFGIIQSLDLTDILIVVVRYFGGTLLGVSGLINAYRNAAKEAINQCTIIVKPVLEKYEIIFAYESINEIMAIIKVSNGKILQQDLSEQCSISLEVTRLNADAFLDRIKNNHLLHNKIELKVL